MVPASTTLTQETQIGLESIARFDDAIGWATFTVVCIWAVLFMIRSER